MKHILSLPKTSQVEGFIQTQPHGCYIIRDESVSVSSPDRIRFVYIPNYFKITAIYSSTISFLPADTTIVLFISKDGIHWSRYKLGSQIKIDPITQSVYFKGAGGNAGKSFVGVGGGSAWTFSSYVSLSGNPGCLIDGNEFSDDNTTYNMTNFFKGCPNKMSAAGLDMPNHTYIPGMFADCQQLYDVPVLNDTTVAAGAYANLFTNSAKIDKIVTHADVLDSGACSGWVENVSQSGEFYSLGSANFPRGVNGIPDYWTVYKP